MYLGHLHQLRHGSGLSGAIRYRKRDLVGAGLEYTVRMRRVLLERRLAVAKVPRVSAMACEGYCINISHPMQNIDRKTEGN